MKRDPKKIQRRINKERRRLDVIFEDLEGNAMDLYEGLVYRASFMRITLEDYEKDINERGSVDWFSQGDQEPYERARPIVQLYNTTNKNYQSIIKQLTEMLPQEVEKETMQEILDGLQKPKP